MSEEKTWKEKVEDLLNGDPNKKLIRFSFTPGPDYYSGKATIEDVYHEVYKAMIALKEGNYEQVFPEDIDGKREKVNVKKFVEGL